MEIVRSPAPFDELRFGMTAIWKPEQPVVIAGYTLTPAEAWLRCFTQEFSSLAKGEITLEQLADRGIELYDANARRDPIEVALEEFEKSA